MKKIILVTIILSFLLSTTGYAHKPLNIEISYEPRNKIVTSVITHTVDNTKKHRIHKVVVKLNNKEVLTHNIKEQDNDSVQVVMYRIPEAQIGDKISVEAYCNRGGMITADLEVK